jgi:SAM-dependent methyltransferase
VQDPNYLWLAERFCGRLFAERPASVLDVGCGRGHVVGRCHEHDVPALGLDRSRKTLALVAQVGFRCARAAAAPLPVRDGAFDWVTLRHVLHHVPDPRAAVAEACRVARTGLLLAEPWFDLQLPSQVVSKRAQDWIKAQDRRHGGHHMPAIDHHGLLRLLPRARVVAWEVEHHFRPWPLPLARFHEHADRWLARLAPGDVDRAAYEAVVQDLATHGLSDCGTVLLTVRLRA